MNAPTTLIALRTVFDSIDQNGDGCFETRVIAQVAHVFKKIGFDPERVEMQVRKIICDEDIENKRTLSWNDFQGILHRTMRKVDYEKYISDVFDFFDSDKNGLINHDELRTILKELGENVEDDQVQAMIREADRDGDGQISFLEFVKVMNHREDTSQILSSPSSENARSKGHIEDSSSGGGSSSSSSVPLPESSSSSFSSLCPLSAPPFALQPQTRALVVPTLAACATAAAADAVGDHSVPRFLQVVSSSPAPCSYVQGEVTCVASIASSRRQQGLPTPSSTKTHSSAATCVTRAAQNTRHSRGTEHSIEASKLEKLLHSRDFQNEIRPRLPILTRVNPWCGELKKRARRRKKGTDCDALGNPIRPKGRPSKPPPGWLGGERTLEVWRFLSREDQLAAKVKAKRQHTEKAVASAAKRQRTEIPDEARLLPPVQSSIPKTRSSPRHTAAICAAFAAAEEEGGACGSGGGVGGGDFTEGTDVQKEDEGEEYVQKVVKACEKAVIAEVVGSMNENDHTHLDVLDSWVEKRNSTLLALAGGATSSYDASSVRDIGAGEKEKDLEQSEALAEASREAFMRWFSVRARAQFLCALWKA